MSQINLSGAAWSFVGATLRESAGILRALGVFAMDLIARPGALLDGREIERDAQAEARRVAGLRMELSNLIYIFGTSHNDRAVNSFDEQIRAKNRKTFMHILEFCTAARIPSLSVLPGVDQAGFSHEDSLSRSGEVLCQMTALAGTAGVRLVFEPHIRSVLQSPLETLAFLQRHPGLRIALDYSHFVAQGYTCADIDQLIPYAGHVHLRQGAKGQLQTRWEDGQIDFPAVISLLKKSGYLGYVALEYEHDPFNGLDRIDVITETIKMRNAIWSSQVIHPAPGSS